MGTPPVKSRNRNDEPVRRTTTKLRDILTGADRRPTPVDAFRAARATFIAPQRLDMQVLAAQLDISRATLYRWVGSRDDLLVEILWSLTDRTISRRLREAPHGQRERLASVLGQFVRDSVTFPGMVRFLDEEGDYAVRLLTIADHGFHPRLVSLLTALIEQEVAEDRCTGPASAAELAYAATRIIESFVHRRVLAGQDPDPHAATRVLTALLR